jgi:hypothetical protein
MTIKTDIAAELYAAVQKLGGKSDLLGIIGSYGDTLTDRQVLDRLKRWNAANEKPAAPNQGSSGRAGRPT